MVGQWLWRTASPHECKYAEQPLCRTEKKKKYKTFEKTTREFPKPKVFLVTMLALSDLQFKIWMYNARKKKIIFIFTKKQRSTTTLAFVSPCSALKMKCMFSRNYCWQPKHLIKNRKGLQVQPKTKRNWGRRKNDPAIWKWKQHRQNKM